MRQSKTLELTEQVSYLASWWDISMIFFEGIQIYILEIPIIWLELFKLLKNLTNTLIFIDNFKSPSFKE